MSKTNNEQVNSLTQTQIEEQIIELVATTLKLDRAKITPHSKFIDDLGADSLDQVELMMAIEAAFDCDIPDQEASQMQSIADVVSYVLEKSSR